MLNDSQKAALKNTLTAVLNKENAQVIGSAGTGKSYLIAAIKYELDRLGICHISLAPTNSSANAIGGHTVTKFLAKIPVYSNVGELDFLHTIEELEGTEDVLIVDEAFMCSAEDISSLLKRGICIFVGDDQQLPPVKEDFSLLSTLEMTKSRLDVSMRFGSNQEVVKASELVLVADSLDDLNRAISPLPRIKPRKAMHQGYVALSFSNRNCNRLNNMRLNILELEQFHEGQWLLSDRTVLDLDIYASEKIEITRSYYEGDQLKIMLGRRLNLAVLSADQEVEFYTRKQELVKKQDPALWAKYYKELGKFIIPYYYHSRTVHKAQGQTLEKVAVDANDIFMSRAPFELKKKLLYTAITRSNGEMTILE